MADNIRMDRRGFVAGLAGVYAVSSVTFAADVGSTSVGVGGISYSRTIPIKMKTDVFIAGGGSAGIAAAIAARAAGVRVFLAEGFTCFGGMGTAARVPVFMQWGDGMRDLASGFGTRFRDRLQRAGAMNRGVFDFEAVKREYDSVMVESGADFIFQTRVIDVILEGAAIRYAVVAAPSGIWAVEAKVFIDATGNGDVAVQAGVPFEKGDSSGHMMPASLLSAWSGVDWERWAKERPQVPQPFGAELARAAADGVFKEADLHMTGLYKSPSGIATANIGHIFNLDGTDERSLTKGYLRGRESMKEYERYFQEYLKCGLENIRLVETAAMMGVRETRRIRNMKSAMENQISRLNVVMPNAGINISRRELIAGVGAAALCGGACAAPVVSPCGAFREKERDVPLDEWADVIVAGGGPAGIAAAVSAARAGKKVRLFELQGCLGGVWTAGLLSYIFDFNKSEIGWEIIRRLDALGARRIDSGVEYDLDRDWTYEPEYMKFVCEEMCREAGVRTVLQCPVVAAYRDASGRNIETIVTESKSGRRAWRAKTFIDCTGDGDLAALAGCGFDYGYPGLDYGQPATMNALVAVDDGDAIAEYVSNNPAMWSRVTLPDGSTKSHHIYASHKLKDLLHKQGLDPSYGDPTLFRFHKNVFCFMANHEYRLRVDDAEAVSEATMRSRREIVALASALEKLGGPWKGFRVIGTAEQIGHRDARRIHGRYTVTRSDIENGTVFDDVCTVSRFGIDIHGIDKKMNDDKAAGNSGGVKFRPFQIPLRSCIAKDADNLYMAGRNISGDFYAQASYRVTGSSVALGEAVGKAAAGVFKPVTIVDQETVYEHKENKDGNQISA